MINEPIVVGLGEVLWDCFPDQRRLGGAPANFACHAKQLGLSAYLVSCLGDDSLGQKAREVLATRGVDSTFLFESDSHPTGTVEVTLDAQAKPTYTITENVAWDYIRSNDQLLAFANKVDAACFGTLAQRSTESRSTIQNFLRAMPAESLKIFDVNLRQRFYSKKLVAESLETANILKLSDEELPVLAKYFDLKGDAEHQLKTLVDRFQLKSIAYTLGAEGSQLVTREQISIGKPIPISPVDSVGAGDSFTAALTVGLLRGCSLEQCNALANHVAAFVCSNHGACPTLPGRTLQMVPTSSSNQR